MQRVETLEKKFSKAERKIAEIKLKKMGYAPFYNDNTKRTEIVFSVFHKKDEEMTRQEKKELETLEKLCNASGIFLNCLFFVDDVEEQDEWTQCRKNSWLNIYRIQA